MFGGDEQSQELVVVKETIEHTEIARNTEDM
jgi:hypothetical protein